MWCNTLVSLTPPPPPLLLLLRIAAGDSLLVLPAFHLPLVTLAFLVSARLPGGRAPHEHHAFPLLAPGVKPPTAPQAFVDVFEKMRCQAWTLGIEIAVSHDRSSTGCSGTTGTVAGGSSGTAAAAGGAAAAGAASAVCAHYFMPPGLPHAFLGQFQMKFIIDVVDTLVNPSAVVRLSRKLKPHHARDRRPEAKDAAREAASVRARILPLPQLKQAVEISLTAERFRVHHDAQDGDDPSDMVYIDLSRHVLLLLAVCCVPDARTCLCIACGGSQTVLFERIFLPSLTVSLNTYLPTHPPSPHLPPPSPALLQRALRQRVQLPPLQAHRQAQQWRQTQGLDTSAHGVPVC